MYKNPQFEGDRESVLAFMRAHPFITLIGYDGDYPVATQVPVAIEDRSSSSLCEE